MAMPLPSGIRQNILAHLCFIEPDICNRFGDFYHRLLAGFTGDRTIKQPIHAPLHGH
jgi:hypothetical protein